ncbi:hypothetical protein [Rhodoferax sp.]|uniref:hypothetical protein n=1 Tax=Rhodoferax sp. TaxID=50421 RepID=UPI002ACE7635|nr:hypothetical protein [Rhodoferax sp.]MDZ7918632.1 hypothetical protein [Rhodoferax sp.]
MNQQFQHPIEWECFSEIVQSKHCSIADWGPLHGPISSFTIRRDAELNLILETTSGNNSRSTATHPPLGTVQELTNQITFKNEYLGTATAVGLVPQGLRRTYTSTETGGQTTETSSIHALTWTSARVGESAYTMDWLESVPNAYHWPHIVDSTDTETISNKFRADDFEISMNASVESRSSSLACAHLRIDGMDIFVGTLHKKSIANIEMPGYILYKGCPDASFREKLRGALSFALGQYLVYLGHSSFNEKWDLIQLEAISPATLGGAATKLVAQPPAPLDMQRQWWISPDSLQRVAESIFQSYDKYGLRSALWGYWHGMAAPAHIAAVHFAAVIERLQTTYFTFHDANSKSLLDKKTWKELQKQLVAELEKVGLTEELETILRNKLDSLNSAPQSILMKRFLGELNIEMGSVETRAWREGRNRAAHGGVIERREFTKVVRENKSLRVLINRMILAMCGAADFYIDYYTLEHPIQPIQKPSPEDLG